MESFQKIICPGRTNIGNADDKSLKLFIHISWNADSKKVHLTGVIAPKKDGTCKHQGYLLSALDWMTYLSKGFDVQAINHIKDIWEKYSLPHVESEMQYDLIRGVYGTDNVDFHEKKRFLESLGISTDNMGPYQEFNVPEKEIRFLLDLPEVEFPIKTWTIF